MSGVSNFDGVVTRFMARFGGNAVLRVYSVPTYIDGEAIENSVDLDMKVLLFDYPQIRSGEKAQTGTSILEGDLRCMAQPINKTNPLVTQPVVQANRDIITINNTVWKIMGIKDNNPSGVDNVIYEFHLRK